MFLRESIQRIFLVYSYIYMFSIIGGVVYVRFVYRFFEGCDCADKMCFYTNTNIKRLRLLARRHPITSIQFDSIQCDAIESRSRTNPNHKHATLKFTEFQMD